MYLYIEAVSDPGNRRSKNEDLILVGENRIKDDAKYFEVKIEPQTAPVLFAVADGMGGHRAGEIASEVVLSRYMDTTANLQPGLTSEQLADIYRQQTAKTHSFLKEESKKMNLRKSMGATVIGALFYEGKIYYLNAGDSRLYRFRHGYLRQISTDHSVSQMRENNRRRTSHVIYNSVGGGRTAFIDFDYIGDIILDGDVLLLCSDGLTDMLDDLTIAEYLSDDLPAEFIAEKAKEAGGIDNISILIIKIYKD